MDRNAMFGFSAALALALSACGANTPASQAPTSTGVTTQQSDTPAPAEITPINGNNWLRDEASKSRSDAAAYDSLLTDLRLTEHDTFYRAVLQFQGQEEPAWYVTWSDEPV